MFPFQTESLRDKIHCHIFYSERKIVPKNIVMLSVDVEEVHVTTQKIVSAVVKSTQGMILPAVNSRSSLGRQGHNFQFENQCPTQLKCKSHFLTY